MRAPARFFLLAACAIGIANCRRHRRLVASHVIAPARAYRASRFADLVAGPSASGRVGDVVMENRFVRAVVNDVSQGGGFALSGGQLVDLALRDGGEDEIGQVFGYLGRFPRQLRHRTVQIDPRHDGVASVTASGDDPRAPGLEGSTTYTLGPDDRAITLTTRLTNRGALPTDVGLGDALQWSRAEHWIPGFGFSLPRETHEPYVAGVGVRATYVYAARGELDGPNGGNFTDAVQRRVTLAPGASIEYVRRVGVSRGGDVSGALEATRWHGESQALVATVREAASGRAIEGVRIVLHQAERDTPIAMGASDARGDARVAAAAGVYRVEVIAEGRAPDESTMVLTRAVNLGPGAITRLSIALGAASTLSVRVRDGSMAGERYAPGRVLVYGIEPTPTPSFGAIGRADGARNSFVVSHRAAQTVPLAPGRYRVVATRGPMRTLAEQIVVITAGEHREVTLTVRDAIDRTGYLCGDFHTHQTPSLDSPVSLRDRVRASAAEGLDVIATTDHNVASDLAPAVRDEGLTNDLLALPGDEVSTDVALHPSGHWNLYPLHVRDDAPLGGAPDLFDLDPAALVRRARVLAPGAIVQVNHPRSGVPTGMFDVVGFDRETGHVARGAMTPEFDAIEVWNGRYQQQSELVLQDWLALLRTGARITGTANSDSHSIALQEVGYPRTCFAAATASVVQLVADDVVHAIREARDAIMTDGPLIRVTAPDGQSAIGRTVPPHGALAIDVQSAAWMPVTVLEMIHADGTITPVPCTFRARDDRVEGSATVAIDAREPFVLFRARGTERISVLIDDPPLYPLAITNPVYIARAMH